MHRKRRPKAMAWLKQNGEHPDRKVEKCNAGVCFVWNELVSFAQEKAASYSLRIFCAIGQPTEQRWARSGCELAGMLPTPNALIEHRMWWVCVLPISLEVLASCNMMRVDDQVLRLRYRTRNSLRFAPPPQIRLFRVFECCEVRSSHHSLCPDTHLLHLLCRRIICSLLRRSVVLERCFVGVWGIECGYVWEKRLHLWWTIQEFLANNYNATGVFEQFVTFVLYIDWRMSLRQF